MGRTGEGKIQVNLSDLRVPRGHYIPPCPASTHSELRAQAHSSVSVTATVPCLQLLKQLYFTGCRMSGKHR